MKFAEDNDGLANELESACDNPKDFDFAFKKERESTGFANFGFDPVEAARLRGEEIEDESEVDPDLDMLADQSEDSEDEDEQFTDDYFDEDEDEYDRFSNSVGDGFDDEDDEVDNWE